MVLRHTHNVLHTTFYTQRSTHNVLHTMNTQAHNHRIAGIRATLLNNLHPLTAEQHARAALLTSELYSLTYVNKHVLFNVVKLPTCTLNEHMLINDVENYTMYDVGGADVQAHIYGKKPTHVVNKSGYGALITPPKPPRIQPSVKQFTPLNKQPNRVLGAYDSLPEACSDDLPFNVLFNTAYKQMVHDTYGVRIHKLYDAGYPLGKLARTFNLSVAHIKHIVGYYAHR